MARRLAALALCLCARWPAASAVEAADCPAESAVEAEERGELDALRVELLQARAKLASKEKANYSGKARYSGPIVHYAKNCDGACSPGICESYCGANNACCKKGDSSDPDVCVGVGFWPVTTFHTCVQPAYLLKAPKMWCGDTPLSDNWDTGETVANLKACQDTCNYYSGCRYFVFGLDTSNNKNRCAVFQGEHAFDRHLVAAHPRGEQCEGTPSRKAR